MQSERTSGRRSGTEAGSSSSRPRDDRSGIQKEIARAVSAVAGSGRDAAAHGGDVSRTKSRDTEGRQSRQDRNPRSAQSSGSQKADSRQNQAVSGRKSPSDTRTSGSRPAKAFLGQTDDRRERSIIEDAERAARNAVQPHLRKGPNQGGSRNARPSKIVVEAKNGRGGRVKQYIDPDRFVREAVVVEQEDYIPQNRFEDFKVHKRIIANLIAKGYETPTPIQDQTIQLVLDGKDVVGIANTGTGKTAAFSVPLIHDLITNMDNRLLIMAPTRELAQQIVEEMLSFSKGCGFKIALIIGGASMNMQEKALKQFPRIVVGTPGRIKDHIGQGTLDLSRFNRVVLDEVDRMLDMGFIKDITSILSKVNPKRQSLFFSATMEPEIEGLIGRFSRNPVTVSTRTGVTADSVNQNVIWYRDKDDKIEKLHELLISGDRGKTIIFDDTKRLVEKLGKELAARGFNVDRIHGDKSQAQRSRAITRLKSGEIDILVATDVAARGIDVSDVTHVINFSQPNTYDDYVHRIGRTGRAGKTGQAWTFVQKP
jgi:superfamily II DNA or RNA helicase